MNQLATDASVCPLVPVDWDLPEHFRKRLGDRVGRQRSMVSDGHLLLVLHAPPVGEEPERIGRLFWRHPDGSWQANCAQAGLEAIEAHFAEYHQRLEELDEREHRATTADEYFHILSELAPLVRSARHQHQALQQARVEVADARDVINFRDLAYELERQTDLLHADAKNTFDFTIAKRSEEQAKASEHMASAAHRLNVLAGFFFPIVTLSAVMGTNLKNGWEEAAPPWPLIAMLGTGLLCGVVLRSVITRGSVRPQ